MSRVDRKSSADILRNYVRSKDENKPHLMKEVFSELATLDMVVKQGEISFPSRAIGLADITGVLVRNFSDCYENIYTFCLQDSLITNVDELSCYWVVGMSEKESGRVKVGCGTYDWHFDSEDQGLADHLFITVEQMVNVEPEFAHHVMEWMEAISYPWCDFQMILFSIPDLDSLLPVLQELSSQKS